MTEKEYRNRYLLKFHIQVYVLYKSSMCTITYIYVFVASFETIYKYISLTPKLCCSNIHICIYIKMLNCRPNITKRIEKQSQTFIIYVTLTYSSFFFTSSLDNDKRKENEKKREAISIQIQQKVKTNRKNCFT